MPIVRKNKPKQKPEQKTPAVAAVAKMADVPAMGPQPMGALKDAEVKLSEANIRIAELTAFAAKAKGKIAEADVRVAEAMERSSIVQATAEEKIAVADQKTAEANERTAELHAREPVQADTSNLEEKVGKLSSVVTTIQESLAGYVEVLQANLPDIEKMKTFVQEFGEPVQTLTDDISVQVALVKDSEGLGDETQQKVMEKIGEDRFEDSLERVQIYSSDPAIRQLAKDALGK